MTTSALVLAAPPTSRIQNALVRWVLHRYKPLLFLCAISIVFLLGAIGLASGTCAS
jgi:hypothetical protein